MAPSSSAIDDATRRAELSRKLPFPVLKPMNYRKQVGCPGSCSAVWMSEDGATVVKTPLAFYLDGCDGETTREYKGFDQESRELLECEKKIYNHLGRHSTIFHCIKVSDTELEFPFMKKGNLRTFLRNDIPKPLHLKLEWIKTAFGAFHYIHSKDVVQSDVSARNFLVRDDLSIVLSNFSASKLGDEESLVRPETRLIYEIVTGKPPYDELEDNDVEKLFKREEFPSTFDVYLGGVIRGCWVGNYETVKQILDDTLACESEEGEGFKSRT
ncbi:MAG: hypothetical protein Q9214_000661 [Letrouitia sp. 1 TL-2023]